MILLLYAMAGFTIGIGVSLLVIFYFNRRAEQEAFKRFWC